MKRFPKIGSRVMLVRTNDPYTKLKFGSFGKVIGKHVGQTMHQSQVWIQWDSGSNLSLIPEKDLYISEESKSWNRLERLGMLHNDLIVSKHIRIVDSDMNSFSVRFQGTLTYRFAIDHTGVLTVEISFRVPGSGRDILVGRAASIGEHFEYLVAEVAEIVLHYLDLATPKKD
jgi:hypothetical protein